MVSSWENNQQWMGGWGLNFLQLPASHRYGLIMTFASSFRLLILLSWFDSNIQMLSPSFRLFVFMHLYLLIWYWIYQVLLLYIVDYLLFIICEIWACTQIHMWNISSTIIERTLDKKQMLVREGLLYNSRCGI